MPVNEEEIEPADANTYRPFKVMDSAIMKNIAAEIETLGEPEEEGAYVTNIVLYRLSNRRTEPIGFVGALTKAICCETTAM